MKNLKKLVAVICAILFVSNVSFAVINVGYGETYNASDTTYQNSTDGAFSNLGTLNLTNVKFLSNENEAVGGAIKSSGGVLNFSGNIEFNSNKSETDESIIVGGGAINLYGNTIATFESTENESVKFINNSVIKRDCVTEGDSIWANGGAIRADDEEVNINFNSSNILFEGNSIEVNLQTSDKQAHSNAGAISSCGNVTFAEEVIFKNNNATAVSNINARAIAQAGAIGVIRVVEQPGLPEEEIFEGCFIFKKLATFDGNSVNAVSTNNESSAMGGAIENLGTLTFENGAIFKNNTATGTIAVGGAIFNYGTINLIAKTNDVEFTGNTANGVSSAIDSLNATTNLWASDDASIIFNDRISSVSIFGFEDTSSVININKTVDDNPTTGTIILNEDMSGYTGQINLYNGTVKLGEKGKWFGGNLSVEGESNIDFANNIMQSHNFNSLTLNNTLKMSVDVDLVNSKMDTISATEVNGAEKIRVESFNILSDTSYAKIKFVETDNLKDKVTSVTTASSALYVYDVSYDATTGSFTFSNPNSPVVNPTIAESAVASTVGGFATQSNVVSQAFISMDNHQVPQSNRAKLNGALYASTANQIFESSNSIESGLWIRPFVTQDKVKINGLNIDNTLAGTLAGIDLASGENGLFSVYIGYAGSKQKYEDVKANQTGYIVGATAMLVNEKYYLGLTANVNFNKTESKSDFGTDKFDTNMYSIGAKAGYNIDLGKNFILEPNLMVMYGLVATQSYETALGAKIDSQNTNNIMAEPQLKLKVNLEKGWQPYVLVGYIANLGEKGKVVADGIEFESDKIDGYTEYGAGVNKNFINSHWSGYVQATGTSGGRSGVNGNLGIKYSF